MAENAEIPSNSRNAGSPAKKQVVNYQSIPKQGGEPEADRDPVKPIVQGQTRKKPITSKIAEAFTGDDARSVGNYVLMDVAVPALKNMIVDAVQQSIERMLFGSARRPSTTTRAGFVNYSALSTQNQRPTGRAGDPDGPGLSNTARARMNYDEIVLSSRADGEEVLAALRMRIEHYDVTTLSDLLEMIGVSPDFTDHKFGWFDLRAASVVGPVRGGGYLLNLPKPEAIQ